MASGWKFSVTVPSWTQTTLENDEVVVVRSPPQAPVTIAFIQGGGSAAVQGRLLLVLLSLIFWPACALSDGLNQSSVWWLI